MKPPATKRELYSRLAEIVQHGTYTMPSKRYRGAGAPGIYVQDLLGIKADNKDISDSVGFELKFYTKKTNLITLFHKEPKPEGVVYSMVQRFGWPGKNGCRSFRHTIAGKSDRFQVFSDANQINVRRLKGNGIVPYWTFDDILSSAGAKLRRLILVRGTRKGQEVKYEKVDCYENFQLNDFIWEIVHGIIKIDFDAREMKPGSKGLRNHGTKFRVSPYDICGMYLKKDNVC